jgi:UDP-N-acetylmuramate dehydrogenase
MGGCAKIFIEIETEKQLIELIKFVTEQKIKFYVLGGGSNILFDDNGFDGIIIKLTGDFKKIEITDNILTAGAGTFLAAIINKTSEQSLSGLEHLTGIPGTLGGAIFGNAGVKNYEISTFLSELEIINYNGEKQVLQKNEVNFEYRKSNLTNCIITKAKFILKKADKNDILQTVFKEQQTRKQNQPLGTKNAGCIFKNPLNDSAGRIIDSLNLKNFSIGDAKISDKHANFFINKNNASCADMLNLINFVRDEVYKNYKIKLETEIKIIK